MLNNTGVEISVGYWLAIHMHANKFIEFQG